jgi:trehalose 6-phosphate phosphatase
MQALKANLSIEGVFENLAKSEKSALLLDYDGTLAPFRKERDEAFPYPGLVELLDKIIETGQTRLVIISGRRARDLTELMHLKKNPEIWGSHGNERLMPDGSYKMSELSKTEIEGLKAASRWALDQGLQDYLEGKPAGLAFHWRGREPSVADEIRKKVVETWQPILDDLGLKLLDFDGGIELKVAGRDKGNAVKRILTEIGDDVFTAYLGDDLTDEDAFRQLHGRGISILVRPQLRETEADFWIKPPDELLKFLQMWISSTRK